MHNKVLRWTIILWEDDPSLPDADVFLQQQHEAQLALLHGAPLTEVQHVRAEEDDEAEEHQLGGVLQSAVGYTSEHFLVWNLAGMDGTETADRQIMGWIISWVINFEEL